MSNNFLLCLTFLPVLTCVCLLLTPTEEHHLQKAIEAIFIIPNSTQLPQEDFKVSTNTKSGEVLTISDNKNQNCECVCSNGIDMRTSEDPCYNVKKCCKEAVQSISLPSSITGCGIRNDYGVGGRIGGSGEALFAEFPWTVAVLCENGVDEHNKTFISFQCGGSVIHPQVILTAAHCTLKTLRKYYIRAGEWDTNGTLELKPHQDREVKEIVVHYEFDKSTLMNDIALLILKEPLIFAQNVQPVCLPRQNAVAENTNRCFASGWGVDVIGMKYQAILKKVDVPIVSRDICEERLKETKLGQSFFLGSTFICAGGEFKKDTCQGDGGSPLVCPVSSNSKRYYQYGIVSWGVGCGESNVPGVYVNVAMYRDWIDFHTRSYGFETSTYDF